MYHWPQLSKTTILEVTGENSQKDMTKMAGLLNGALKLEIEVGNSPLIHVVHIAGDLACFIQVSNETWACVCVRSARRCWLHGVAKS